MSKFKVRRVGLFTGGIQVGGSGSPVSGIYFGTVSACVPAGVATSGLCAGSMSLPGVPAGAKIFFSGSLTNGVTVYAASVDSTGVVTASYVAAAGATIASTLVFNWIAFVP